MMILGLVALPVLIGILVAIAIFIIVGAAFVDLAKFLSTQIKEAISNIKTIWRSE